MQVKVCPKCGAENRADRAACSGCYTSLEGVAVTEAAPRPAAPASQPQAQGPAPAQPVGPSPLSGPAISSGQPPVSNYGAPPGAPSPYGPPPNTLERRPAPVKSGPNVVAIILVIVLLVGVSFGGWWGYNKYKTMGPTKAAQEFMDAGRSGDFAKFKASLTKDGADLVDKFAARIPGGEATFAAEMKKQASQKMGKIIGVTFDQKIDGLAYVSVEPPDKSQLPAGTTCVEIVCSKQDGEWKVDLRATGLRMQSKLNNTSGK